MKRIAIIGSGGTGKSTLSKKLGELTGLPVFHLDSLYWKPGWVPTPDKEWDLLLEDLISREEWILDGNYGRTMDIRLREADTIIYLDYPTYISLGRAIKRRFQYYGKSRPDMGEGCPEKLDLQFVQWIYKYRKDKRPGILKKLDALKADKQVLIFTSPGKLEKFLEQLKTGIDINK